MTRERVGGLRADPEVLKWQKEAATNPAALTAKQRRDRKRVRVRVDVPETLRDRLAAAADAEGTSVNQLGAFLLCWVMDRWDDPENGIGQELRGLVFEAKEPSRSPQIEWNLSLDNLGVSDS